MQLLVLLKKLQVGTAADQRVLGLHLILHDQGLALVVNLLGELGRDGVVSSLCLGNETLVALNKDGFGILDLPLADVTEGFAADGSLLGGFGRCPPF